MKPYLFEGGTKIVLTDKTKTDFKNEDDWLTHLLECEIKLSVHQQLEADLSEQGFKDGDEVPEDSFKPAAVPLSMEDDFTDS